MWFDTPIDMTPERSARFVDLVRELSPGCLINGRLDQERRGFDYASMRDNQVLDTGMQGAWETPATINDTWGYKKDDHNWKPADTIVYRLVDVVSKGGNYLLNVGPTADGVIPEPSVEVLERVGEWLNANGEAIYGAGPTRFGHELRASSVADSWFIYRRPSGWRCTAKPGRIYVHLFDWPAEPFCIKGIKENIVSADLLADPGHEPLRISQNREGATIDLVPAPPAELANVLRIRLDGSAE